MGTARWGRDTTFVAWLAPYLLLVAVCSYALGYLSAGEPTTVTRTRTIDRQVITEIQLDRLEAIADALTTPTVTSAPLSDADRDAITEATDAIGDVESGEVIVTPTPTTTPLPPPTTTTPTVEPGGDRHHVFDFDPPPVTVTVP